MCCNFWKTKEAKYRERDRTSSSESTSQESEESSEEEEKSADITPPVPEDPPSDKEPTPPASPSKSSEEDDFVIPAMAVYVDDKNDAIHEMIHEVKTETEPAKNDLL
jgi:hypothetical protein